MCDFDRLILSLYWGEGGGEQTGKVGLSSDDLPDLHGNCVGRELHVGSEGKETVMINDKAYHDGGMWLLDRWWPIRKKKIFTITYKEMIRK